ncbi:MAG TPA: hypothetical protein VGJ95_11060 [Pseudonocardiaceae bacterium]
MPGRPGAVQPAPAPRFSRTAPQLPGAAPAPGQHTTAVVAELSYPGDEIARLLESGCVAQPG